MTVELIEPNEAQGSQRRPLEALGDVDRHQHDLLADPRITVCVTSLLNPYQCVTITGHVVAHESDDNAEHFAKMVRKYRGSTPVADLLPAEQQRVIFKIAVDRFGYRTEDPPEETRDLVRSNQP